MDHYKFYCELYKNHYFKNGIDNDFDDDDFEIPAKLNRTTFHDLTNEYLSLERKMMLDKCNEEDFDSATINSARILR